MLRCAYSSPRWQHGSAHTRVLLQPCLNILPPAPAGAIDITNPNKLTPEQVPIQDSYNTKIVQLAFLVACLYTASGLLGFSFIITRFPSYPTIAGFTSGASVIIGLSQVGRRAGACCCHSGLARLTVCCCGPGSTPT